jgi:hypothetical protein
MGLFGGSRAKEGLVQTVAVKGDRKATMTQDSGTIVDLAEEKVYEVNLKDRSYKVVTFAELRKKLEEARRKAEEDARKAQAREKKDGPVEDFPHNAVKAVSEAMREGADIPIDLADAFAPRDYRKRVRRSIKRVSKSLRLFRL